MSFLSGVSGKGRPIFEGGSILANPNYVDRAKILFSGWPVFPYVAKGEISPETLVLLAKPEVVGIYTRIGDYLSVQVWDPTRNVSFLEV